MRGSARPSRSVEGEWWVTYYRPNGKRTSKSGFKSKREADAFLNAELAKIDRGDYIEPSKLTVEAHFTGWLETKRRTIRQSTYNGYEAAVKHIDERLGNVLLRDLTADHLDHLYTVLLKPGGHRQRKDTALSPRSVQIIHGVAYQALGLAVKKRLIAHNPAEAATPPTVKAKKHTYFDGEQVRKLLASCVGHRLYAAVYLAVMTGLRRGELLGTRWCDLDLDGGQLRVVQCLIAPRYQLMLSDPKTDNGKRTVSLDPATVAMLKAHRKHQVEERMAFGKGWGAHPLATDLVFTDEIGHPIKPALFSLAFASLVKAAGLPRIRLHDLRHTHVALLGAAGVHPQVASERLGHHSPAFTLKAYGGSFPQQHTDAAEKFAALVTKGG